MIKPYLFRLLDAILVSNNNFYYMIETEGHVEVEPTRDIYKCCNLKENDKYIGVDNLDYADIHILEFNPDSKPEEWNEYYSEEADAYITQKFFTHEGALRWCNFNTGTDKLYDYLGDKDFDKIVNKVYEETQKDIETLF